MATLTGVLSVNAAFLREIKEDNHDLHVLRNECTEMFRAADADFLHRVAVEKLTALRDQLAIHFALEEAFGYFENAIDVAPWLNERACALRDQHDALFRSICDVVNLAEEVLYHETSRRLKEVADAFRQFDEELDAHEEKEQELILTAYDDDIGVGD